MAGVGTGIMNMFSNLMGNQPAQQSNQPPGKVGDSTNPGNIPAGTSTTGATSGGTAPNGVLPVAGNDGLPPKDSTPFADFQDLWKNEPTDPNALSSVFGDLEPKKFMEAAGRIDFSKAVTPEMLTAISAGGEPAMAAFAQAMNKVAQGVYAQSAFATTKIVEQALARSKENFLAELPQHIKKEAVRGSLRAENPIFSNPAVQPIISALEAQMTVKYPNASAGEITAMAKQYVEALGTSFAPKPPAAVGSDGKPSKVDVDWERYFTS